MATKKKEVSIELRDLIVQGFKGDKNGKLSTRALGIKYNIPKSTVQDIISRYKERGTVRNQTGRGRKAIVTQREERTLVRKVKVNPSLSAS